MATIVVTGGSSGVGLAAAKQLVARGDEVILVGRDPQRLAKAVAEARPSAHFRADFEILDDVRALAEALADRKIDVLVNNAGGMVGEYRRTVDGFEATVQGNHLAPFLLTTLLREQLRDARVVNTASQAHRRGVPDPANLTGGPERYSSWSAYSAAKACNVLFAAEAARRWPDILSVSFHPGVVRTNFGAGAVTRFFWRHAPFLVTPEKAGELLVWLATAPRAEPGTVPGTEPGTASGTETGTALGTGLVNGAYYVGRETVTPAAHARSADLAKRLWDASSEAVKE